MNLTRTIEILPAWDKRNADPKKNYGVHGCELRMMLGNEKGYVQFVVYLNWFLPETEQEFLSKPDNIMVKEFYPFKFWQAPQPADLGYHSPNPFYEGQTKNKCHLLPDGCYYDGSGLQAEDVFTTLRREGSEGVWKVLESRWHELFDAKS